MRILPHADLKVAMAIYIEIVSSQTRDALRRLGEVLAEMVI